MRLETTLKIRGPTKSEKLANLLGMLILSMSRQVCVGKNREKVIIGGPFHEQALCESGNGFFDPATGD